jgi:hypothetical protein
MAGVLREAAELCRRLDLPKQAALFDGFVDRLLKEQPISAALRDEACHALSGPAGLFIWGKLQDDPSEYNRLQLALGRAAFPQIGKKVKRKRPREWQAVRDSGVVWELGGESDLRAVTLPHPPTANRNTTIRLTHSNTYGPVDDAEFFVRTGDMLRPTGADDLDSATDWVKANLVEELVYVEDTEMLRSEAQEPFEDETPWWGTYDAPLVLPAGRQRIEIKVVSHAPNNLRAVVLADWEVNVQE